MYKTVKEKGSSLLLTHVRKNRFNDLSVFFLFAFVVGISIIFTVQDLLFTFCKFSHILY